MLCKVLHRMSDILYNALQCFRKHQKSQSLHSQYLVDWTREHDFKKCDCDVIQISIWHTHCDGSRPQNWHPSVHWNIFLKVPLTQGPWPWSVGTQAFEQEKKCLVILYWHLTRVLMCTDTAAKIKSLPRSLYDVRQLGTSQNDILQAVQIFSCM